MSEPQGTDEPRPALARSAPDSIPDLTAWLANRATVREYDPEAEITDNEIRELVDAGRKAPTSGTTQSYSFVRVTDDETRARIHELCGGGTEQITTASHFLLTCIDVRRNRLLLAYADRSFAVSPMMGLLEGAIDASLAAQQTMTAAESRGYGVCPIGNILTNLDAVAREVDLPKGILPIFGLAIGVPAADAPRENAPRLPLETILHEDTYIDPDAGLCEASYERMNSLYGDSVYGDDRRTWDETLARYWGPDGFVNSLEDTLRNAMAQQGFFDYRGPRSTDSTND